MPTHRYNIKHYTGSSAKPPFKKWLKSVKDRAFLVRFDMRLERLKYGYFGDYKSLGDGVYELRFTFGPGYRIYYAIEDRDIILLLTGGDKHQQQNDIKKAKEYWYDYRTQK